MRSQRPSKTKFFLMKLITCFKCAFIVAILVRLPGTLAGGIPMAMAAGDLASLQAISLAEPDSDPPARSGAINAKSYWSLWCLATIESLRQAGYPVNGAELERLYRLPSPGENAATTFLRAFQLMVLPNPDATNLPFFGRSQIPALTNALPKAMKPAIADVLKKNRSALKILCQDASPLRSRYPIDLKQIPDIQTPHLTQASSAIKLLLLQALLAAENSDSQQAAQSLVSGFRLAASLEEEPVFISQLMRMALNGLCEDKLERVVNRVSLTDHQLQMLIGAIQAAERSTGLTTAFIGERCKIIEICHDETSIRALHEQWSSSDNDPPQQVLYRDFALCLKLFEDTIIASKQPFPQALESLKKIRALLDNLNEGDMAITSTLIGGSIQGISKHASMLARLRTAHVALAVERFRRANRGTLPISLESLTPQFLPNLPQDPFTGRPIQYRKLSDKAYVIHNSPAQEVGAGDKNMPKTASFTVW